MAGQDPPHDSGLYAVDTLYRQEICAIGKVDLQEVLDAGPWQATPWLGRLAGIRRLLTGNLVI